MEGLTMRTKIRRWGHSLAVRIPKPFAIEARLGDQTEVDLAVVNGKIVVTPARLIEDLLAERLAPTNVYRSGSAARLSTFLRCATLSSLDFDPGDDRAIRDA